MPSDSGTKIVVREDTQYQQVVFAEVVTPNVPNVYGDMMSVEGVRDFAYGFMMRGFSIDINHDNADTSGKTVVVESYMAKKNDPDGFTENAWVVGTKILDKELFDQVLSGHINGYSYEALVTALPIQIVVEDHGVRVGTTEPAEDGHAHAFAVEVDENNRPVSGGTDEVNGHSHTISTHTVTNAANGHVHRYEIGYV